jgi:small ligand-binding sensory domain FIST
VSRIGAGLSTEQDTVDAAHRAAREAVAGIDAPVDLAFVFLSPTHRERAAEAAEAVLEELRPRNLVGCVARGIVARERELEEGDAAGVWAASLPGAEIETFHAETLDGEDVVAVTGMPALAEPDLVALLVDPFTFRVPAVLELLNARRHRSPRSRMSWTAPARSSATLRKASIRAR